jgi:methylenetetrahydrofolate reductase (NADPH)
MSHVPKSLDSNDDRFALTVEVVPPVGPDATPLLTALKALAPLTFSGFSVATNPVAKPRMSALALSALIQRRTGRPVCLHCTTRDHNRLSLQALLWGARALGIGTVLVTTGDFVALGDRARTTTVRDIDVFGLVRMAREAALRTGVVLNPHPESGGLAQAVDRLERKGAVGAQFAVTQPLYDIADAQALAQATQHVGIPVLLGILPLRTARHAEFLHHRVAGIAVPAPLRERMRHASDPVAEGVAHARAMLALARDSFAGACIMPPFDHYEVLFPILAS